MQADNKECCKGCNKNTDAEADTKEIYEEIKKLNFSGSLQKKLLKIQKLNEERTKLQEDTYEAEYLNNKTKYEEEYMKLYSQIQGIVNGTTDVKTFNLSQEECDKYKLTSNSENKENGIPNYWGIVLKHAIHSFTVNTNDEKILNHLKEIKYISNVDKLSYTIEFHFDANDFFTNEVLSKTYIYSTKDHQLKKVETTTVDWKSESVKPSKMIKTKTVKKGKTKQVQTIEKEVETFFNIFNPITVKEEDEHYQDQLTEQAEEGEFFRDALIPYSVEYFLDLVEVDCFEEGEDDAES